MIGKFGILFLNEIWIILNICASFPSKRKGKIILYVYACVYAQILLFAKIVLDLCICRSHLNSRKCLIAQLLQLFLILRNL